MKKQNRKETDKRNETPKLFEKNDPRFMENPFAGYKNGLT